MGWWYYFKERNKNNNNYNTMANTFKHKETGEIISVSRVRYFVDGKPPVDLSGEYDLSQYVEYNNDKASTSFDTIRVAKSPTDGHGIR